MSAPKLTKAQRAAKAKRRAASQAKVLAAIAAAGDEGASLRNHAQWSHAERLVDLGLVRRFEIQRLKMLANGDARLSFMPRYEVTPAGRAALEASK